MKKIWLLLLFIFTVLICFSQNEVPRSSASVTPVDPNLFTTKSFRPPVYADTTLANAAMTLDSCGKIIFVRATNSYWGRKCNPKRWEVIGSGGGVTSTWQETLTAGSTLTTANTIDGGSELLSFTNMDGINITNSVGSPSQLRLTRSGAVNSRVLFDGTSTNNYIQYDGSTMTHESVNGYNINVNGTGMLQINGSSLIAGLGKTITMQGGTSGTITITPPATITDYGLTLPPNAGTANYVLQTNGFGVTSWVAQTGGLGVLDTLPYPPWTVVQDAGGTSYKSQLPRVYNVLDYGADNTFATDATEGIQAAINAAASGGGGIVYFPKGRYKIADTTVTNISGRNPNSKLYIPLTGGVAGEANNIKIKFLGESEPNRVGIGISIWEQASTGAIIECTDSTSVGAAILGSDYQTLAWGDYNYVDVTIDGLTFRNKSKWGSIDTAVKMTAIDFSRVAMCSFNNIRVDIQTRIVDSKLPNTAAVGVKVPLVNNFGFIQFNNALIQGYYIGHTVTEHTMSFNSDIVSCFIGVDVIAGNHPSVFTGLQILWCNTAIRVSGIQPFTMTGLDIERYSAMPSTWYDTDYDLDEVVPGSLADIQFHAVHGAGNTWVRSSATPEASSSIKAFIFGSLNRVVGDEGAVQYSDGNVGLASSSNFNFYDNAYGNLVLGDTTSSPSASIPTSLDLGGAFSSVAGSGLKLKLWHSGSSVAGLGYSLNQMDFSVPSGTAYSYYINGSKRFNVDNTAITHAGYTQHSVPFIGASGLFSQNNSKLYYNDAASSFGVNTNTFTDPISGNAYVKINGGSMNWTFTDFSGGQGWLAVNNGTMTGFLGHTSTADGLVFGSFTNHALKLRTNNVNRLAITNAGNVGIGDDSPAALFTVGSGDLFQVSSTGVMNVTGNSFFGGTTTPTAWVHMEAGTTSKAPQRFTSGPLTTGGNILAGNVEFLTDKFYATITTGTAVKEITLNDAALTSGTTPVATTNGRLTDGLILAAGTYTPTLTNVANIAASTAYSCQYMRVGNTVTVSGKVDIDPTTTVTDTQLRLTLPIASALANENEAGGTSVAGAIAGMSASILGDATNDAVILKFLCSDINNNTWAFTFTYRII